MRYSITESRSRSRSKLLGVLGGRRVYLERLNRVASALMEHMEGVLFDD